MRVRRSAATASAILLASAVSTSARAWGPEGHAIVADIAEVHLTPTAAAQVTQLLALEGHTHLDQVASWADDIRSQRRETAPWHFVDIPLSESTYDPARDCLGGNCVVNKIVQFTAILADHSADPQSRMEALKWVVHFVGDIHQPLHAEDDGDRGGYDVRLTYFGKPTNLHAIWDGGIIEHATCLKLGPHFSIDHQAVASLAANLDNAITPEQMREWAPAWILSDIQPVVVTWAEASHELAKTVAYGDLPAQRTGEWSGAYQAQAWPVAEIQLQRAGVRLAELLNEALR